MQITLNGETLAIEPGATVQALLEVAGHADQKVAVEVNRQVVPRSRHASHALVDGDRVEIIRAIGGG